MTSPLAALRAPVGAKIVLLSLLLAGSAPFFLRAQTNASPADASLLPLSVGSHWFNLPEPGSPDLWLHRTGLEASTRLGSRGRGFAGGHLVGAYGGQRAGYIALGAHAGTEVRLAPKWYAATEGFVWAGGGGSAPDGDGGLWGVRGALRYQQPRIRWEVGAVYTNGITGTLGGWRPTLGLSKSLDLALEGAQNSPHRWAPLRINVGLYGQQAYVRQPAGDLAGNRLHPVRLVGAEAYFPGKRLHRFLRIAAAADTFGGYMHVLHGWGLPLLTPHSRWELTVQGILGAGGGGASLGGDGGLHAGWGVSGAYRIPQLGILFAAFSDVYTNGPMGYRSVQVGARLPVVYAQRISQNASSALPILSTELKPANFYFGVGAKLYASADRWALCPGGELQLLQRKHVSLWGSTWWAGAGGNLGAYAEGLLDVRLRLFSWAKLSFSFGVGAGGGINPAGSANIAGVGLELGPNGPLRFHRWINTPTSYSLSWIVPLHIPLLRLGLQAKKTFDSAPIP